MKTALLTALVLLAATPAWTGDGDDRWVCQGTVSIDTAISKPHQGAIEIVNTDVYILPCFICSKPIIKRLLKVCPEGSECSLHLRNGGYGKAHYHAVGPVVEITKWPADGVERTKL
jgi:hypothetical protein